MVAELGAAFIDCRLVVVAVVVVVLDVVGPLLTCQPLSNQLEYQSN